MKRNIKNYLLILLFIVACILPYSKAMALPIIVKQFYLLHHLPSPTVNCVYSDHNGIIWIGTKSGVCRYDGYRIQTFRSGLQNPNLLVSNDVLCIAEDNRFYYIGTRKGLNLMDKRTFQIKTLPFNDLNTEIRVIMPDKQGGIWIGTYNRLVRLSADLQHCERFDKSKLPVTSVNSIFTDRSGNLWAMFWKRGLWKYDKQRNRFVKTENVGQTDNPFRMFQDKQGRYWLATWGEGVFRIDNNGHVRKIYNATALEEKTKSIYGIVQDQKYGYLWMVGQQGFCVVNPKEDKWEEVESADVASKMNHFFNDIYEDPQGNIWISAANTGIYQLYFNKITFANTSIEEISERYGLDTDIRSFFPDNDGDGWLSQQGIGLCLLHPNGSLTTWHAMPSISNIKGLTDIAFFCRPSTIDQTHLWVAPLYDPQIWEMAKQGTAIKPIKMFDLKSIKLGVAHWYLEDSYNNIWISTSNGIGVKPYNRQTFQNVGLKITDVFSMTEIKKGEIWLGSRTKGLYKVSYQNKGNKIHILGCQNISSKEIPLPTQHVEALATDFMHHKVWIGMTEGQLLCYNTKTKQAEDLSKYFLGSIQNEIVSLTTDNDGNVWIATTASIIKYDPQNHDVNIYTTNDKISVTSIYKYACAYPTSLGRFYYGGTGGIVSLDPRTAKYSKPHNIFAVVSDVKIGGQSILSGLLGDDYQIDNNKRQINIGSGARNIEIDLTACNYINPRKTIYAYKLEGVDRDWTYTGEGRTFAFYNDLPKGNHKLLLRATDANGQWSKNIVEYNIYRKPYIYETWWAYIIYVLCVVSIIVYIYHNGKRRLKERERQRIAKIEKQKDEELTQAKLRYFTNVSHDFLTPITVISCVIDDMKMSLNQKLPQLDQIKVNLEKLKQLIQQVLDFRKIDNGKMHLQVSQDDLIVFLTNTCRNYFEPMVKIKHLAFEFHSEVNTMNAWFDHDKLNKIMINLLSNAFKYTTSGSITVTVKKQDNEQGKECAAIAVKDTGKGMKPEEVEHIFERFYTTQQRYDSNGIGLSLVKELTELHHASIHVESEEGKGSVFTLLLPIALDNYTEEEVQSKKAEEHQEQDIKALKSEEQQLDATNNTANADDKTLLIVEDNEELLTLMERIFSRYHQVIKANNGQEALKVMETKEPDLIISDVMMPVMDGLTLCRQLKNNVNTSHIPVILLTAKNTAEDRAECYDAGANGYVAKPFELNVLKARIDNFLRTRYKQQTEFRTDEKVEPNKLQLSALDKKILDKSIVLIEEHLDDENFDVVNLAEAMCMSKSTLYRKIKAITGLSPVEFIRNIRLKHAYQMLQTEEKSITDIAFACGFSTLRYFSKCFKEEFGVTPTDLRKNG